MATRRRRTRKLDPADRIDHLYLHILDVSRRWSRDPKWDLDGRPCEGFRSNDELTISALVKHPNRLQVTELQLTIYSREDDFVERDYLGSCNRVYGSRTVMSACEWLPLAEAMALAPSLVERRFVEFELRIKGFFRARGWVVGTAFNTRATSREELPGE